MKKQLLIPDSIYLEYTGVYLLFEGIQGTKIFVEDMDPSPGTKLCCTQKSEERNQYKGLSVGEYLGPFHIQKGTPQLKGNRILQL